MVRTADHNCLFCGELFTADARNAKHQRYCSKPLCRKASKAASRRAWLAKTENQDDFRGAENVARVQKLTIAQTARFLGLHEQTVTKWVNRPQFQARKPTARSSRLDPFKAQVVRLLETHPFSAQQIYQRLRESGFDGGFTILKDYVRKVRPVRREAFLKLSFAPGEAAQVDWGEWGSIGVGSTRRRLSFFVMVLCYSRLMYVEFTVSQTMEHFLAAHEHAFAAFGGCPTRLIIDNLKSAVLSRVVGEAPVFNPRYVDFARHWGFGISPCNVAKGNEKGRVENGVGYVKKNLLNGADFLDFNAVNPAATAWLATIANVRIHGETHRPPVDMFKEEQSLLLALNPPPYDIARIASQRASKQFRVALDANQYSVPAEFASQRVTVKATPDWVCVYHQDRLIARHVRHYDRHQDYEDPDHPKALLEQRRNAREQRLLQQFLGLSRQAQTYYVSGGLFPQKSGGSKWWRNLAAAELDVVNKKGPYRPLRVAVSEADQNGGSVIATSC